MEMTMLSRIEVQCPLCQHGFYTQKVVATNAFGGKRTDFHERAAGQSPLPHYVHACMKCGYAGTLSDFQRERIVGVEKDQLLEDMAKWRGRPLTASERYEAAAHADFVLGEDYLYIGRTYLSGAWACVEEADTEAERWFRIKAAENFAAALAQFDSIDRKERAVITYLTGELWRRIGFAKRAAFWFAKVPGEVVEAKDQAWIVEAAKIQSSNLPREWFG